MININLLATYVENNLGQIITRDNTSGKICGYNLHKHALIFGFENSDGYGWNQLSSHDVILVPYKYYRYFIEENEVEKLILNGEFY